MINSNTNAVNTIDASNTEVSPVYSPQDHSDQQQQQPSPSPTFFQRTRSRLVLFYKSIPYSTKRKSLRNIRLLILALSFVSLILDAITLSFEVRVMNLDWSTIQKQAAMLLTPDLLAMTMTLVLLMFTSDAICCCFGNIEDVMEQEAIENEYHEEPYDYEEEEEGEEPLHEEHQRQYRSTDQLDYSSSSHHREQHLEQQQQQQQQQGLEYKEKKDKGRKQELYEEEEEKEEEILTRRRRSKVAFVNSPETIHETRMDQREAFGASSPSETPRIIITDTKTSNNTLNSISAQPNADAGASRSASTIPIPIVDEKPEATTTMMEELPAETVVVDETARSRRLYTIFRIVFSIGLFILAIYWPAIDSPTPVGHLPNSGGPKYPPRNNYAQGRGSTNGTSYSYEDFNRTMALGAKTRGSGYHTSHPNTSSSAKDRGWSYGYSHFCALEQTFGDNQSASVYCQVKVIRPGVTYAWAVLLVLELCIAASAGDFSKNRGRPMRDFQSTETIDEENLSGDLDGVEGQIASRHPSSS
ncbi:hypothetical protein BGX21_008742 [Mortierella sp. AD011]|nr:hypothetical protein BGX20_009792 [Mortierella sp. AD010]KAF9397553.1 hypothetical protein BGX21_008742 [Mortierella sp. AD011]